MKIVLRVKVDYDVICKAIETCVFYFKIIYDLIQDVVHTTKIALTTNIVVFANFVNSYILKDIEVNEFPVFGLVTKEYY